MSRSVIIVWPTWLIMTVGVLCSPCSHAMGWFSSRPVLHQTELTPSELKNVAIHSGWSNDDPDLMMFEVKNQLSGPIFCTGANFEFKDGKKRSQSFDPKLYIPSNSIKRTAIKGIEKKHVKAFGFSCLCMKTKPTETCENAFN